MRIILVILFMLTSFNVYAYPAVQVGASENLGGSSTEIVTVGVARVISGNTTVWKQTLKADSGNTGDIYVGGSDVSPTTGVILDASEVWVGTVNNLNKIYIDGTVVGDSVGFTYEY